MADIQTFDLHGGAIYALISWMGVEVKVAVKPGATLGSAQIYGCETFQNLFRKEPLRIPKLDSHAQLSDIAEEIADQVAIRISRGGNRIAGNAEDDSCLLKDLARIGWSNVVTCKPDENSYELRIDGAFNLVVRKAKGVYDGHLVPGVPFFQPSPSASLAELFNTTNAQLKTYTELFDNLELLDNTYQAEFTTKYSNERRIRHTDGTWLVIRLDPDSPSSKPTCSVTLDWKPERSFAENMRTNFDAGSASLSECGICSAVKNEEGQWPDYQCSSEACKQPFHLACLSEWFLSDPRAVRSFGRLKGACPFCEASNTVSM